jgi:hypothetical protein
MAWTQNKNQSFATDNRGWKKGESRSHSAADKKQVIKIRKKLVSLKSEFYIGPETILSEIEKSDYANKEKINLSFIKKTLKDTGLAKIHKKKTKGNSVYQHYPKTLIEKLGATIVEIDFLERTIKGQTKPLNFMSFSCKKLNLRQFRRISAQTSTCAQTEIKWFCDNFFAPDGFKMDNGLSFIGTASGKRSLSKVVLMLLGMKILPIFTNPRSPWNNGSVEGSNSVFARNFWNKFIFNSTKDVDRKLESFNASSLNRSKFKKENFKQTIKKKFIPKIYFIRKVNYNKKNKKGEINILNEKIYLPKAYINLFTISEWKLKTEILTIMFEKEQKKQIIKKIKFKINKRSKNGVSHFI